MIDYAKRIAYFVLGVVVIFAAYSMFRSYVSDDGARIQRLEGELNSIRADNRSIRAELKLVSETVARSRIEVGESRTTVIEVRERLETDGRTIAEARRINSESQSVLDGVFKRATETPVKAKN